MNNQVSLCYQCDGVVYENIVHNCIREVTNNLHLIMMKIDLLLEKIDD
jgi:hypothetical protein